MLVAILEKSGQKASDLGKQVYLSLWRMDRSTQVLTSQLHVVARTRDSTCRAGAGSVRSGSFPASAIRRPTSVPTRSGTWHR